MKFYVDCVGCEQRQLDAQRIITYLELNGHKRTTSPEPADYNIIVTCGVDKSAEKASLQRVAGLADKVTDTSRLIVSGCLPAISPDRLREYGITRTVSSRRLEDFDKELEGHISVPMREIPYPNKSVFDERDDPTGGLLDSLTPRGEYELAKNGFKIRVNNGCLMACSYCVIRDAMGKLVSVPFDEIVEQFEKAVQRKEPTIMLMGGDTGVYGYDIGTRFYTFLDRALEVPGNHRVFIHDFNVNWYLRHADEYDAVFEKNESQHHRLRGVNMPVQSGSDRILKLMKRPYTSSDVVDRLKNVKKRNPSLNLGTHIITGFPTETETDFNATMELLGNVDFDFLSVFMYSEHERAKSAGIGGKVGSDIARERASRIANQFGERVKVFG